MLQKVYFESESDGAATFEAIRYGNDTNAIKELVYIYQCDKSYGYTREGLESVAFKDQFPLISAFSIYDDGDLWTVVVHTKNVDTSMVLQMLQDKGLIIPEEGSTLTNGIRADYYIQSILDQGGREATASEIAALHLP